MEKTEFVVPISSSQKSFWQAITVGDLKTVKCLLETEDIDVNMYDMEGDQRKGGMSLHLAILEMPTWKGSENGGIQTEEYVRDFIQTLLDHGADMHKTCNYMGEWYLQTGQGKTKSFFPNGYDSLGVVLQFIEITAGADVITNDVTKRLELIRDMLLAHKRYLKKKRRIADIYDSFKTSPNGGGCGNSLNNDMKKMLLSGQYSDVTLRCQSSLREFKCHKLVLAARSSVFDKMFSLPLAESRENVVTIKEVHPETLEAFLEYLYTDRVDEKFLPRTTMLLEFANRYDVESLKLHCSAILCENLTVSNAASLLSFAHKRNCLELKDNILRFISENVKGVIDSDDFLTLDSDLVRAILTNFVQHPSPSSGSGSGTFFYGLTGSKSKKGKMSLIRSRAGFEGYLSRCRQADESKAHSEITLTTAKETATGERSRYNAETIFSALPGNTNMSNNNPLDSHIQSQNESQTISNYAGTSSSGSKFQSSAQRADEGTSSSNSSNNDRAGQDQRACRSSSSSHLLLLDEEQKDQVEDTNEEGATSTCVRASCSAGQEEVQGVYEGINSDDSDKNNENSHSGCSVTHSTHNNVASSSSASGS